MIAEMCNIDCQSYAFSTLMSEFKKAWRFLAIIGTILWVLVSLPTLYIASLSTS